MDRSAQMFMTPQEFEQLVSQVTEKLKLRTASDHSHVYLTTRPDTVPDQPGQGVRLHRPQTAGRTLYLVQHDIRTDDPDLISLFDRLRRTWRGLLSRPVQATNTVLERSTSYSDIGFTAGALALHDAGWNWRQEGVTNVNFAPDETARPPVPFPTR